LLVVGRSDIAHELHDQSRVPERAGGNDGQSASERRLVAASTPHAPAALAPGAEALKAMGSDSVRTRSGSGGDDGLGEVALDSRVSERLAARRSADLDRAGEVDRVEVWAGNLMVFHILFDDRTVGDGSPAYDYGMEARTVVLTVLGLSLVASVAVSCGAAVDETASLGTSRPPATVAAPPTDPPSELSTASPTTMVETTVATEPIPDDPCLGRFREFEAAERVTDSPITVEINLVEGMYVVDTFQDNLFLSRGCTDMFMTDPSGSHAAVVSSENTVFVALSTLGTDPRWDFTQGQSEVVDLGVEQAAVVQYIEIPRSERSTALMPVLAGGAELASVVASIEPQGLNSIAMPSTADIAEANRSCGRAYEPNRSIAGASPTHRTSETGPRTRQPRPATSTGTPRAFSSA
jgi:hypothetical protein